MYITLDENGRVWETDHPLNILSFGALGPQPEDAPVGALANGAFVVTDSLAVGGLSWSRRTATGLTVQNQIRNNDNTSLTSSAKVNISVGGASAGDASIGFNVNGAGDWTFGVDNSDSDTMKWDTTSTVGGATVMSLSSGGILTLGAAGAVSGFTGNLQIVGDGANAGVSLVAFNTSALGPFFGGAHANGTRALPTATASADVMFRLFSNGYYTSGGPSFTTNTGRIEMVAAEAYTSTAWGSYMAFSVVAATTTTLAEALRIESNQVTITGSAIISGKVAAGGAAGGAAGSFNGKVTNASTNTPSNNISVYHSLSAGTAAAGFGTAIVQYGDDNGASDVLMAYDQVVWVDATDATRKARRTLTVYDTSQRTVVNMEASGTAAMIGFLGAAAIVRPASTDDLRTALINLGLYTTGGATPLNLNGGALTAAAGTFTGAVQAQAGLVAVITDASTNTQPTINQQYHKFSGVLSTIAAGYGTSFYFQGDSTTTTQQAQGAVISQWVDPTHATRTGRLSLYANDSSTGREGVRVEADGSAARIGFLGAAAVVRPTSTTDLRTALINLGLYTTGGASPLDLNGGALAAATASLSGKITSYNGVTTAGNGVGSLVTTVDLTGQGAAVATTTLYAVPASGVGLYVVYWYAKVTTAAGTSSTLGPLTIAFTDATDSTARSITAFAQFDNGATGAAGNANNSVANGTATGTLVIWAKASTNITYAMAYASNAAGAMKYELHIKLEWLG